MFAHLNSIGLYGMDAFEVNVEADISNGLPGFDVVGLPDTAVKESRDRVRSALKNCGFTFPMSRITVNLAPADKRKEGPIYDLPILLAILTASGQLSCDLSDCAMIGELSLSGEIHGIRGVLPMAIHAKELGYHRLFVPAVNAAEGAVVEGLEVYPVTNVKQLIDHLTGNLTILPQIPQSNIDFAPPTLPPLPSGKRISVQALRFGPPQFGALLSPGRSLPPSRQSARFAGGSQSSSPAAWLRRLPDPF